MLQVTLALALTLTLTLTLTLALTLTLTLALALALTLTLALALTTHPFGLRPVLQGKRPVREPFRTFMAAAKRHSHCVPFADHPLGSTMYDAPVVNVDYAPPLPTNARPREVCAVGGTSGGFGGGGGSCTCAFRRLQGVDNAALAQAQTTLTMATLTKAALAMGMLTKAALTMTMVTMTMLTMGTLTMIMPMLTTGMLTMLAQAKPAYGYGTAIVKAPAPHSLAECEARCCREPTCHSVSWLGGRR